MRLKSVRRDMMGARRRSRRELLRGGGGREGKEKERGAEVYGERERDRERKGVE